MGNPRQGWLSHCSLKGRLNKQTEYTVRQQVDSQVTSRHFTNLAVRSSKGLSLSLNVRDYFHETVSLYSPGFGVQSGNIEVKFPKGINSRKAPHRTSWWARCLLEIYEAKCRESK